MGVPCSDGGSIGIVRYFSVLLLSLGLSLFGAAGSAYAFNFLEATHLLDLRQGSSLSAKVGGLRQVAYESAYGSPIPVGRWYATRWVDMQVSFLTQINRDFGVLWGMSTGEKGEKYVIAPSFKLGLIYNFPSWAGGRVTIRAYHVFSGALREKTCTADYGEIGGVREVNCRLAASMMTPEETLRYNFNDKPQDRNFISIEYRKDF